MGTGSSSRRKIARALITGVIDEGSARGKIALYSCDGIALADNGGDGEHSDFAFPPLSQLAFRCAQVPFGDLADTRVRPADRRSVCRTEIVLSGQRDGAACMSRRTGLHEKSAAQAPQGRYLGAVHGAQPVACVRERVSHEVPITDVAAWLGYRIQRHLRNLRSSRAVVPRARRKCSMLDTRSGVSQRERGAQALSAHRMDGHHGAGLKADRP